MIKSFIIWDEISLVSGPLLWTMYSRVPNRRVGWNKRVGGKIAGNLINKLDGIKELVGNCTKAKNELVRNFNNFIALKITLSVHQLLEIELVYRKFLILSQIIY